MQPLFDDDFPYMTDKEVAIYHRASLMNEDQRTEAEHKAIRQWGAQPNLMALHDLMEKLRADVEVSVCLDMKIEELCVASEAELSS